MAIKVNCSKETYIDIDSSEIDRLIEERFKIEFNTAYILEGARLKKKYIEPFDDAESVLQERFEEVAKACSTGEQSEEILELLLDALCTEGVLEAGCYLIAFDD